MGIELETLTLAKKYAKTQLANISTDSTKKVSTGDITTTGRQSKSARVSFIADDGYTEDYTILKPIFQSKGVVCSSAIVSGWVDSDPMYMSKAQIIELQSLNWEIMSHTVDHLDLRNITEAQKEAQLYNSKKSLESMGFRVSNVVYPYGGSNKTIKRISRKYYRSGYLFYETGKVNSPPYNTYNLHRMSLGASFDPINATFPVTTTFADYYKPMVDMAVAQNSWLIITLHPGATAFDATQQGHLSDTIDYIKSLSVPIQTPSAVLNDTGNIIDMEGYSADDTVERYLKISNDGSISTSEFVALKSYPTDTYTCLTPVTGFPACIISQNVVGVLTDTPTGVAGMLTTDRTACIQYGEAANDVSFQTFKQVTNNNGQSGLVFTRTAQKVSPFDWGNWASSSEFVPVSTPPTTGTWKLCDRIYNSAPTAAGYIGWVCITAGTPGTWKGFGIIQA